MTSTVLVLHTGGTISTGHTHDTDLGKIDRQSLVLKYRCTTGPGIPH